MQPFSRRYGYIDAEQVIIREDMPKQIVNATCTAFDRLSADFRTKTWDHTDHYMMMEQELWVKFLNLRLADFSSNSRYNVVATELLCDNIYTAAVPWYTKLDMVEHAVRYLLSCYPAGTGNHKIVADFIAYINGEYERLNYAYRIIGDSIVEITSPEEIESVNEAMASGRDNIMHHLSKALEAYAKRPAADYTNSIKESISAVEAFCREITGKNTLGEALNALERSGLQLPPVLKAGFEKLYAYTNQPTTGIRHALIDNSGAYVPANAEARYMLVTCSAFINYLRSKTATP